MALINLRLHRSCCGLRDATGDICLQHPRTEEEEPSSSWSFCSLDRYRFDSSTSLIKQTIGRVLGGSCFDEKLGDLSNDLPRSST